MKTFEEVKEDLLRKAKEAGACADGYRMGLEAENKADLLKAITENWCWVLVSAKIIDAEYLKDNFTEEELNEAGIYVSGIHETSTIAFACGRATVEAYGRATVEACGRATVKAYDSATVKACGRATVEAYGRATVEAYGRATVEACGRATVKAYDNATVEACNSAIVRAYDNATVEAYEESYIEDFTENIRPEGGYAIVKDYYNSKIYIKKGKFEIIEIE